MLFELNCHQRDGDGVTCYNLYDKFNVEPACHVINMIRPLKQEKRRFYGLTLTTGGEVYDPKAAIVAGKTWS